jgi:signal transduction histidine kinase
VAVTGATYKSRRSKGSRTMKGPRMDSARTEQADGTPSVPPPPAARAAPLWIWLAGLVALAVLPMVAATALWLWGHAARERGKLDDALSVQARALSLAIEREVSGVGDVLDALSRSPHLENADLAAFHSHASRIAESRQARFISLFAPDGRQLVNTARPYGAPLPAPFSVTAAQTPASAPPTGDVSSLRRVFAERSRSNSHLFRSLVDGELALTVDVPVFFDTELRYALNIALQPAVLNRLVNSLRRDGQSFLVIDGRDVVLARSDLDGSPVGQRAGEAYVKARRESANFVSEGRTPAGVALVFAGHTSAMTGWTAVVAARRDHLEAAARDSWVTAALALGATCLLGCVLAGLLARRIVQSVGALTLPPGQTPEPAPLPLPASEFRALRQQQMQARRLAHAAESARQAAREARLREQMTESASRAKDRFIATLAHELRSPLQVIGLSVAQLRRKPESLAGTADRIERQYEHIARLVDELTDEAAVARGKVALQRAPLDFTALVRACATEFRERDEGRGRALSFDPPSPPVWVDGDAVRLRQIVRNLLDNAARYSPAGTPIALSLHREGDRAELAVRDLGQGIAGTDLERVFQPYEQLRGDSPYRGGLGLGLPLARNLARLHGGELWLESEGPGQGCTARLRLPAHAQPG